MHHWTEDPVRWGWAEDWRSSGGFGLVLLGSLEGRVVGWLRFEAGRVVQHRLEEGMEELYQDTPIILEELVNMHERKAHT